MMGIMGNGNANTDIAAWPEADALALSRALYLAGVYVSEAEDAEGEDDDDLERVALARALRDIAQDGGADPLARAVAEQTLGRKGYWPTWRPEAAQALDAVRTAVQVLDDRSADPAQRRGFRAAVLRVGRAVAEAYGEYASLHEPPQPGFFARLFGFKEPEARTGPGNISAGEAGALDRLARALGPEGG